MTIVMAAEGGRKSKTSVTISSIETIDIRFPTSRTFAGSDAMNVDPDYSAAYVILKTDTALEGHGFAFTIGRGNDICAAAIEAFRDHVVGLTLNEITEDFGGFWRRLAGDSQLRWLGPEKGVIHLATGAVVGNSASTPQFSPPHWARKVPARLRSSSRPGQTGKRQSRPHA